VNAIQLPVSNYVASVNSINATKQAGEPAHAGNNGGKSAWWRFTAPSDGILNVSTTNSTFDTVMGIYTGPGIANLTSVSSNDDANPNVTFSSISQAVRSNTTYYVAVDGFDGTAGVIFLSSSFTNARIYRVTTSSGTGGTVSPASFDVVSNTTVTVTATPNIQYQFNEWSGSVLSLSNPLTVTVRSNLSLAGSFLPLPPTDGFESGNLTQLPWTSAGNQPWFIQTNVTYSGGFAARSGVILHNQSSSLLLSGSFRAGVASFNYKVSSEQGYDWMRFYVDGILRDQWSGEVGWSDYSVTLPAGNHTLEWRYVKDAAINGGSDAAYLDNLNVPVNVAPNASAPARLTLKRQSNGPWFVDLTGQTNQLYVFQVSTNLVNWQSFSTNVALGGFARAVDSASSNTDARYYRAIVP
jgi:hypothetical protein